MLNPMIGSPPPVWVCLIPVAVLLVWVLVSR